MKGVPHAFGEVFSDVLYWPEEALHFKEVEKA